KSAPGWMTWCDSELVEPRFAEPRGSKPRAGTKTRQRRRGMTARMGTLGILGSVLALALLTAPTPAQAPAAAGKPAAVVNGEPIPLAEVDAILKAQGPTAVKVTEAQRRQMAHEVLDVLVDDLLFQQFLRQH